MIVLHGAFLRGQLYLWGETPTNIRPRGRQPKVRALPYDAGSQALNDADSAIGLRLGSAESCVIWLPTVGVEPVASSSLIAEPPGSDVQCNLSPWRVTAFHLSHDHALDLLLRCAGRDTLGPGTVVGSTLLYWSKAARYAAALVAREQFLPGLTCESSEWKAVWEPAPLGSEMERMSALAAAMPSACRSLAPDADVPPETPATDILAGFLRSTVDALIRGTRADHPTARRAAPAFDSLHDQWLWRLQRPLVDDARMSGSEAELRAFAGQIAEWRKPLAISLEAPFRLCFRLEEPLLQPDGGLMGDEIWTVRYLLQSRRDPSLLVPTHEAWSSTKKAFALLQVEGFRPREFLLTALGQAARVCLPVETSLKQAAPGGFDTDTAGAEHFLTEHAWLLEQAGFGLLLPKWWSGKGKKAQVTARASVKAPSMKANAGLSMETLVQFDWQVALGGETLTPEELEELAARKSSLVRFRGKWVQLDSREIEAALQLWKKRGSGEVTVGDVVRMTLGAADLPSGIAVENVHADGWVGELLAGLTEKASFTEADPPADFRGTLRPYQRRGFSWLGFLGRWGLGACLADDMGLGKTVQVLAAIRAARALGESRPALVICPTSVVTNWRKEAERFTPDLAVMVHHGIGRKRDETFQKEAGRHALVISSYALLHRDLEALGLVDWSTIVLDEAQNIKNPETKQSQAARTLKAGRRVAMTGTPVENHVGDLWAIMDFLNPGFLGTQAEFRRRFFLPIQAHGDKEAAEQLKRVTRPFILRRTKTDREIISDLPDKLEMKVFCTLTREQATLYEAVVCEMTESIDEAEGIQRRGMVLAALSKLKQVCNHPAHFLKDNSAIPGRSGKLARLTEMLEEALSEGDRALIFTQFAEMGVILQRHLRETFGREALFLHGGVPKPQRDLMVERFQSPEGNVPFFILSLKAGGVGLNLTAANHVFHFDRWWNPSVENQATDRAFRIGQTKNVQVHKFVCAGTLEEKIDEIIEGKRQIAENVVGTGEGWLTELSTTELKEMFKLRKEAVD